MSTERKSPSGPKFINFFERLVIPAQNANWEIIAPGSGFSSPVFCPNVEAVFDDVETGDIIGVLIAGPIEKANGTITGLRVAPYYQIDATTEVEVTALACGFGADKSAGDPYILSQMGTFAVPSGVVKGENLFTVKLGGVLQGSGPAVTQTVPTTRGYMNMLVAKLDPLAIITAAL